MTIHTIGGRTFRVLFPDVVRPLTQDERQGLRDSIAEQGGVKTPVVVDEGMGVIDGANRLAIAEELGLELVPFHVEAGLTEEQKRALAVQLNVHRRHLSSSEKREAIASALKANHDRSNLSVAKEVGADDKTVASVRRELESRSEIPNAPVRPDSLGRPQPATKTREPDAERPPPRAPEEVPHDAPPPPPLPKNGKGKAHEEAETEEEKRRRSAEARHLWAEQIAEAYARIAGACKILRERVGTRTDAYLAWYAEAGAPGVADLPVTAEMIDDAIALLRRVRAITFNTPE